MEQAALSEPLQRLLKELEGELGRLSSDNAALRRELCRATEIRLAKETDPAAVAAETPAGSGKPQLLSLSPPPQRPVEPQEEAAACWVSEREVGVEASVLSGLEGSVVARQWRQQFDRLRGGGDRVSAHDLWAVVSSQEHQFYGHNKHPLRTVVRTVRLINQAYGGPESALRSTSLTSECSHLWRRSRSGESWASTACSGADEASELGWETFLAFLADSREIGEEEGGRVEYLRKALRAEANEYIAEEARRGIAQRQMDEVDPTPTGWSALVMEQLPPPVIMVNAICIGVQSDMDSPVWEVLELFFLAFYLWELGLKARFLGCRRFFRGSEAAWNVFDLGCIGIYLLDLFFTVLRHFTDTAEQSNLIALLKFFRLARFARLARIVKSFKSHYFDDLKTMSLGILSGAKVLLWAVILFFACVFVLGVVMRELVGSREETQEFATVPAAMFSVFRCLAGDCSTYGGTPLSEELRKSYGAAFMIPYILIFLVVNFGLFNLIVAVFIDRVVSISVKAKQQDLGKREREMRAAIEEMLVSLTRGFTEHSKWSRRVGTSNEQISGGRRFSYSKSKNSEADQEERYNAIAEAMQQLRGDRVQITRELFTTWLTDPMVLELLENLEIDTSTKMEIFDVCDVDKSGALTCDELVNGLMRLRGPISKCDVIAIRLKVRYLTKTLEDIHHRMGA